MSWSEEARLDIESIRHRLRYWGSDDADDVIILKDAVVSMASLVSKIIDRLDDFEKKTDV